MHTHGTQFNKFKAILMAPALAVTLLASPMIASNESNYTYLALGDSIAFGLNPTIPNQPANLYTGYPEVVAGIEHLLQSKKEMNAACPGESSSSFLNVNAPDMGCNGPIGFKKLFGLKANYPYTTSQMEFTMSQLASNKHIDLVTLDLGANDLALLEIQCSAPGVPSFAACVETKLPGVLVAYGQNLYAILQGIRSQYDGTLVLVTMYSPSPDPMFTGAVFELNQVLTAVGSAFGARVADGFTAFQIASAPYGGDPCAAGLLIKVPPPGTCDVHPTLLGQDILAGTVVFVAPKN